MEPFTITPPDTAPSHPLPEARPLVRQHPKACIPCRTRKVKCDRQSPCSPCIKSSVTCLFPSPSRTLSRLQNGEIIGNSRSEPGEAVLERIRRLESAVKDLGGVVGDEQKSVRRRGPQEAGDDDGAEQHQMNEGRMPMRKRRKSGHHDDRRGEGGTSQERKDNSGIVEAVKETGELAVEENRRWHINTGLLASLNAEAGDVHVVFDAGSCTTKISSPSEMGISSTPARWHDFPFSSSDINIRSLHPSSSQIWLCWQIYVERVDPLVKILHKPTIEKLIMDSKDSLGILSKSTEALIFAIYLSAVTSLTARECEENFEENKKVMIRRFGIAVEQALVRADFLASHEIVNLQAFVLFLVCAACHGETKFVWTLTGLALRMAHSLGLHHEVTGVSSLETEARRRLWWQIYCLDEHPSKYYDSDSVSMELTIDTKLPLNINDSDLDPGAVESPVTREGVTDTTFCLIRYEVARAGARIGKRLGFAQGSSQRLTLADEEKVVKECYQFLETKYLKYCSGAGPLYWLCENMARMIMAKRWLTLHYPVGRLGGAASLSRDMIDQLFDTSIQIVEISRRIETDVRFKKWGWLIRNYQEWFPRAFILAEICVRPKSAVVDRAWRAVEDTLDGWEEATANSRNGILLAKLMQKARTKRLEQVSIQPRNYLAGADVLPTLTSSAGLSDEEATHNVQPTVAETESLNVTNSASSNALCSSSSKLNMTPFADRQDTMTPWCRDDAAMLRDMEIADIDMNWDNWSDLAMFFDTDADYSNNLGTALCGT